MLIKREELLQIEQLIESLSSRKFNIKTQYKFIKIKKAIKAEQELYQEQVQLNCQDFFEKDLNGSPLTNADGGYKIREEKKEECYNTIIALNCLQVQLPDLYFDFDELEELNLSLGELSLLEPFIK